jgi:hypothetical protein
MSVKVIKVYLTKQDHDIQKHTPTSMWRYSGVKRTNIYATVTVAYEQQRLRNRQADYRVISMNGKTK